jgi:predicted RNA-binding Zn ribbon-like protein
MVSEINTDPPAPHGLDLVIDFVNTLDVEEDSDALNSPGLLAAWLAERGLLRAETTLTRAERGRAIDLRESLRALMAEHNGAAGQASAAAELESVARRGDLGVHFGEDGGVTLAAGAAGFDGALARLLIPVADAREDGSWRRVKACRAGDCSWAFFDRSRNRSGVWCDMAVCGNRTKVRAYRERAPGKGA